MIHVFQIVMRHIYEERGRRKNVGKVVALFGLLVLGCDFCAAESLKPRFQAILNAAVDEGLMAVSAHVSWEDGSWTGVAGKSTADTRAALDSNSLFRLASLTKLFTATVILQLIDEEKVHLDDILTDILPGHPVSDIPHGDFITILFKEYIELG
jgi:CubicO group peptidase (beta-lactamase class C family)